jgi:hypothetical protein
MNQRYSNSTEAAEGIAIQALTFLASDPVQLERFLALTGLDRSSIRAAAGQPGFLAGVLDHLASDESLLVSFATEIDLTPADVERARAALSGPRWHRDNA